MAKVIMDMAVRSNQSMPGSQYFVLKLVSDSELPEIKPGQFAEVYVEGADVLLRRPISIHYVDRQNKELWLLVQKVGKGTRKMSELKKNDIVNVVFPLGNGFTIPEKSEKVLLVGGGVGIAPLLQLGLELKNAGADVSYLLGAKSKSDLVELEVYSKYGEVFTSTEDGSLGEKGFVTQNSAFNGKSYDRIYTCGPTPMMKAVAKIALEKGIDCEVSLENKMACGLGACLCCVEDTKDGHRCVCSDGPVFNVKDLKW